MRGSLPAVVFDDGTAAVALLTLEKVVRHFHTLVQAEKKPRF
jgi:hypothetical protein